ncbi:MAG: hypothetical protein NTZ39_09295 [Methanoregula sp.]|nr:hypothetical protein [Methanoregula sp.]
MVGPVVLVLVELDCFPYRRILSGKFEKGDLPPASVPFLYGADDGTGINAFVNVEGDGGDIKRYVLCLACPLELRVKMRIVLVGLLLTIRICLGADESDGGIVAPGLVLLS